MKQRAKSKEHILSLRGEDEAISKSEIPRFARNDRGRRARNNILGVLTNEKGIALAMILVLSFIALAIMAGLIYMITAGTQVSGLQKRYETSLEAGKGGADIVYQIIAARMDNPAQIETEFGFLNNFDVVIAQACINDKLLRSTSDWGAGCDNSMTVGPTSHDMYFDLGASPTFTVYSKIVDTVEGNSGGDEGLLGKGVVASGSGEVTVVHRPYLYTIEVHTENQANPSERAKLSILYQY